VKFSFPVICRCGETFPVNVSGIQFPEDAHCPKCHSTIWLVEPLGNAVGKAILGRAAAEVLGGDWTMTIVLSAMTVDCEMAFLFMKWNRVELMATRTPNDDDEEEWERKWREESRGVSARLDKISRLLSGNPFDLFLSQNSALLQPLHANYPASKFEFSPKEFFIKELFHRRVLQPSELNIWGLGKLYSFPS
jgi:hypothetical protein